MEKELSSNDSLQIIQEMINKAKNEITDNGFQYLWWGWLVFIACMMQFILIQVGFEWNFIGWLFLMPLGGIVSAIQGRRQGRNQRVKSHFDEFFKYVLIAFLVSLLIVLFFQQKLGLSCYPMVMVIYAVWLFISGGLLKFKPIIFGGIINWILAMVAFFFEFEIQLLLLSLAVLLGYIIPGHLLMIEYNKRLKQQLTTDQP